MSDNYFKNYNRTKPFFIHNNNNTELLLISTIINFCIIIQILVHPFINFLPCRVIVDNNIIITISKRISANKVSKHCTRITATNSYHVCACVFVVKQYNSETV